MVSSYSNSGSRSKSYSYSGNNPAHSYPSGGTVSAGSGKGSVPVVQQQARASGGMKPTLIRRVIPGNGQGGIDKIVRIIGGRTNQSSPQGFPPPPMCSMPPPNCCPPPPYFCPPPCPPGCFPPTPCLPGCFPPPPCPPGCFPSSPFMCPPVQRTVCGPPAFRCSPCRTSENKPNGSQESSKSDSQTPYFNNCNFYIADSPTNPTQPYSSHGPTGDTQTKVPETNSQIPAAAVPNPLSPQELLEQKRLSLSGSKPPRQHSRDDEDFCSSTITSQYSGVARKCKGRRSSKGRYEVEHRKSVITISKKSDTPDSSRYEKNKSLRCRDRCGTHTTDIYIQPTKTSNPPSQPSTRKSSCHPPKTNICCQKCIEKYIEKQIAIRLRKQSCENRPRKVDCYPSRPQFRQDSENQTARSFATVTVQTPDTTIIATAESETLINPTQKGKLAPSSNALVTVTSAQKPPPREPSPLPITIKSEINVVSSSHHSLMKEIEQKETSTSVRQEITVSSSHHLVENDNVAAQTSMIKNQSVVEVTDDHTSTVVTQSITTSVDQENHSVQNATTSNTTVITQSVTASTHPVTTARSCATTATNCSRPINAAATSIFAVVSSTDNEGMQSKSTVQFTSVHSSSAHNIFGPNSVHSTKSELIAFPEKAYVDVAVSMPDLSYHSRVGVSTQKSQIDASTSCVEIQSHNPIMQRSQSVRCESFVPLQRANFNPVPNTNLNQCVPMPVRPQPKHRIVKASYSKIRRIIIRENSDKKVKRKHITIQKQHVPHETIQNSEEFSNVDTPIASCVPEPPYCPDIHLTNLQHVGGFQNRNYNANATIEKRGNTTAPYVQQLPNCPGKYSANLQHVGALGNFNYKANVTIEKGCNTAATTVPVISYMQEPPNCPSTNLQHAGGLNNLNYKANATISTGNTLPTAGKMNHSAPAKPAQQFVKPQPKSIVAHANASVGGSGSSAHARIVSNAHVEENGQVISDSEPIHKLQIENRSMITSPSSNLSHQYQGLPHRSTIDENDGSNTIATTITSWHRRNSAENKDHKLPEPGSHLESKQGNSQASNNVDIQIQQEQTPGNTENMNRQFVSHATGKDIQVKINDEGATVSIDGKVSKLSPESTQNPSGSTFRRGTKRRLPGHQY